MQVKTKIQEYMKRYFKGRTFNNLDDISLLDEGVIDSVAVIEIISFLEESFDIKVEDDEIVPDNLDSINKIELYVTNKLNTGPGLTTR
jgi:acyl carrier protein